MNLRSLFFLIIAVTLSGGCTEATRAKLDQLSTSTTNSNSLSGERSVLSGTSALVTAGQDFEIRFRALNMLGAPYVQTQLQVVFETSTGGASSFTFSKTEVTKTGEYFAKAKGLKAGAATEIKVKVDGNLLKGPVFSAQVQAGLPDAEKSVVLSSTLRIRAGTSEVLRLKFKDAYDNPVDQLTETLTFLRTGGTSRVHSEALVSRGNGEFEIPLTGEIAGTPSRLTVGFLNRPNFSLTSPEITVQAGDISSQFSEVHFGLSQLTLGLTTDATFTLKDKYQNLVAGETLAVGLSGGQSQGTFGPLMEVGSGIYEGVFRAEAAGTPSRIRIAASHGVVFEFVQPLIQVIEKPHLSHSTLGVGQDQLASGKSTLVRFVARDSKGQQLVAPGLSVAFAFSGGGSTGVFSATRDLGDGSYEADLTGIRAGSASKVNAYIEGMEFTGVRPEVQVGPGGIVRMSIEKSEDGSTPLQNPEVIRDHQALDVFLIGRDAAGNFVSAMSGVTWRVSKATHAWISQSSKVGATVRAHTASTRSGDLLSIEAEASANGVLFQVQSGPVEIVHTPQQISDLVTWYKADSLEAVLTQGASVGDAKTGSVWDDWSEGKFSYAANEASSSRRPNYVLRSPSSPPSVLFCTTSECPDSTLDRLRIGVNLSSFPVTDSDFTVFSVAERGSSAANHLLTSNSSQVGLFLGWTSDTNLRLGTTGSLGKLSIDATVPGFSKPRMELLTGRLDRFQKSSEPGLSLSLNGALLIEDQKFTTAASGDVQIPYLGMVAGSLRLGEILIYNRALEKDERCVIQRYLNEKWFLGMKNPCP